MRRASLSTAALAAAATTTAAVLLAGHDASASQAGPVIRLHFVLIDGETAFVDNAPKGEGSGDTIIQSYTVRSGGKKVGRAALTCTVADRGNALTCGGGISLPTGTLAIAGISLSKGSTTTLPVVGGTGRWAGAQGFLISKSTSKSTESLLISLGH